MEIRNPEVFIIGETSLNHDELDRFLQKLNTDWQPEENISDSEKLTEVYGRLCYRSFEPGMNPNVTKVRKENKTYFKNILQSGHGSVLEHSFVNFIFHNVSRVFTHELVRHRVGTAISQESMRYVRLNELSTYVPDCIKNNQKALTLYEEIFKIAEETQNTLSKIYEIDDEKTFSKKKELTSAFRRLIPDGVCTTIGWSCNLRTLRHTIELRTNPSAEEEMRYVFSQVYLAVKSKFSNVFQDAEIVEIVNDIPHIKFSNKKV